MTLFIASHNNVLVNQRKNYSIIIRVFLVIAIVIWLFQYGSPDQA
jgi:hypothetical protein